MKAARRVYVLPQDLHERIQAFCKREDHLSEVEGVRRLLAAGLDQFEQDDEFERRVRRMRPVDAAFAACGHPLVKAISVTDHETSIRLQSGRQITVTA